MLRAPIGSLLLVVGVLACGDSNDPSSPIAGSYTATTLRVTPAGEAPIDLLAAGGSLTLTIDAENQATGTLVIPPSIEGGLNASMAGTAVVTVGTVQFDQSEDTFVRDLTFTIGDTELSADQTLSGDRYEVILARD